MLAYSVLVRKQASQYPVISIPPENAKLVPDKFDGRDSWNLYIRPPSDTRTTPSVAIVAKDVLNDRFTLLSGGQIGFDLDHFQITACGNAVSIFDGWEYIYGHGLAQLSCYPTQSKACSDTQCLEKWNNIPIAKRLFLSSGMYNITSPDMSLVQKIEAIKYDLVKWGPLAAGFLVYENFLTFDGRTTYTKTQGKVLGGHYVSIIGWKDDEWICRNNFGADWGLLGYFRVKMGVSELELEDNVSACLPLLYADQPSLANGVWQKQTVRVDEVSRFNPSLFAVRANLKVNYSLMYSQATIEAIQLSKLHGELKPLIANPKLLPNLTKFWVMDIQSFNFVTIGGQGNKPLTSYLNTNVTDYIVGWTFIIIGVAIFVWIYNKK